MQKDFGSSSFLFSLFIVGLLFYVPYLGAVSEHERLEKEIFSSVSIESVSEDFKVSKSSLEPFFNKALCPVVKAAKRGNEELSKGYTCQVVINSPSVEQKKLKKEQWNEVLSNFRALVCRNRIDPMGQVGRMPSSQSQYFVYSRNAESTYKLQSGRAPSEISPVFSEPFPLAESLELGHKHDQVSGEKLPLAYSHQIDIMPLESDQGRVDCSASGYYSVQSCGAVAMCAQLVEYSI